MISGCADREPEHYLQSPMECIEAIEGLQLDFHQGQVLKYVYRHRYKNDNLEKQLEDLRKAEFYLNRLIHFAQERISHDKCLISLT